MSGDDYKNAWTIRLDPDEDGKLIGLVFDNGYEEQHLRWSFTPDEIRELAGKMLRLADRHER